VPRTSNAWLELVLDCAIVALGAGAAIIALPNLTIALDVAVVVLLVVARQILSHRSLHQSRTHLARAQAHRTRMERTLAYQAGHDPLTGLNNRHRFAQELDRVLREGTRSRHPGAIVVLDVDDLGVLNDAHGHDAGDVALKAVADAIAIGVRETDVLGRIGDDEFAIALPGADERRARAVAERIRLMLRDDRERPVHASAGIALFDGAGELVADDALIAADIALHEAKQRGRDQVRVYRGASGTALTWVQSVRTALAEGRFVLYAQPILDLRSGRVVRQELLLRMLSADGDVIPPAAFIPTAERFGLVTEIDRWVVREGLALARHGERVSINLSAASIGDEQVLELVQEAIGAGMAPGDAIFEITETAAMTNMARVGAFADALANLGCDLALDDFGTGFGSFTYLKHLRTRYLKIDMEFVREIVSNTTDQQVVKAINAVAHSLGKLTIAEGVEDEATLAALRAFDVDCAQGFFVGRPKRISPPTRFELGRRMVAAR
jgi:diguanylate cyclase (GGDEF)-like protein